MNFRSGPERGVVTEILVDEREENNAGLAFDFAQHALQLLRSPHQRIDVLDRLVICIMCHWPLNETNETDYIDHRAITEELVHMRKLCTRHNWPIIDVTRRAIEETAAAVINLLQERAAQAELRG